MMDNRIKKVVDGIKIKADMRENILLNLNSKTKNRKIKNSLRKNIIAICSIALVFIIGSGILSILNLSKEDEAELSNNFSFTVSVYAMESDGTYIGNGRYAELFQTYVKAAEVRNSYKDIFATGDIKTAYAEVYFH